MHAPTADAATARASAVSARSSSSSSSSYGRRSSSADTVTRDSWTFRSTLGASLVASDCDDDDDDDNESDATSEDDGRAATATASPRHDWHMGERAVDASTKKLKLQAIPGFSNNEALKARLPARWNAPASLPRRGQWASKQQAVGDSATKDRLAVKKQRQQHHERPGAHPLYALSDDALGRGKKSLEHKIAMHEELTAIERKRLQTTTPDALDASFNAVVRRPRPIVRYRMSTRLVYALVFASAAALHCGVFNFSREVRRLLRLETTPFGVFLLLCWALVGLLSFAGGWLGDLVHDRVVLLRRGAALWATSVVLLHVAAFQAGSTLSLVLLALALPGACLSHALFAPNCVVLGAETTDRRHSRSARRPVEASASPDSDDAASKCERDEQQHHSSSDVDARQSAARTLAVHTYFSRCFGAALAGSSSVQLFFFLLIDVGARVSRQGFLCMLLSSLLLLGALVVFLFQSRTHFQPPQAPDNSFEQKLARHEKQLQDDDDSDDAFAWRAVLRVFTRAVVGGVGVAALLIALVGVCVALVALLVVPDASFHTRLAAFLMILLGWHAVLSTSKLQLRASSQLATKARSLGVPVRQLESALLLVFFACMSSLSAFLRAQLYTTLVVQLCQTRLALPGTDIVLVHPDALGALVSVVSLLSLPLSTATRCRKSRQRTRAVRFPSISPSRRLSIGVCLALLGVFLSSVVELYRRTKAIVAFPQLACNKAHSDFGVLWTAPHLVLLGLSDAVFRVSLQEQLHSLRLLSSRWPGFVRGVIDLSDMVGYVGALALTSMLSTWLFRPTTSDLALVLLLMTTLLAFAYASLKRVAERIAAGHVQAGVSGG